MKEQIQNNKKFDLEDRTTRFARSVREFVPLLPKNSTNNDDIKQLLRSSGSVGANFIETSEALSTKDFYLRVKICRKEAKESRYWLELLRIPDEITNNRRRELADEATELMRIFGAIVSKR